MFVGPAKPEASCHALDVSVFTALKVSWQKTKKKTSCSYLRMFLWARLRQQLNA